MSSMTNLKRLDTNKWQIRFYYKAPLTGKKTQFKEVIYGTLREAQIRRDQARVEVLEGKDKALKKATVRDFADSFVTMRVTRQGSGGDPLARTTREGDYYALKNHILPDIGDWILSEIQTRDIESVIDIWTKKEYRVGKSKKMKKYKPSTINTWIKVMVVYLRHAYRMAGIRYTPLDGIKTLPEPDEDWVALTVPQLKKLLDAMKRLRPQWYAMAFIGFATGHRFSEYSALHKDEINEQEEFMEFGHSQYRGTRKKLNKSKKFTRVPYIGEIKEVMEWHFNWLEETNHPLADTQIVFPARRMGKQNGYTSISGLRDAISFCSKAAGVPYCGIHGMRRTFISIWLTLGYNETAIQAFTTHSSRKMMMHYSHISIEERAKPLQGYLEAIAV